MSDDIGSGQRSLNVANNDGEVVFESIDLAVGAWNSERYRIAADDPLSATVEFDWTQTLRRGARSIRTEIRAKFSADATTFRHHLRLDAFDRSDRVFSRDWELIVPRDNV